jgi:hypothetical protein
VYERLANRSAAVRYGLVFAKLYVETVWSEED